MVEHKLPKLVAWVRFPSPAPMFLSTMFSCKFRVPNDILGDLDVFFEESGIDNSSVFENTEFGFSDRLDENGFPIANLFDVEIIVESKDEAERIGADLINRFNQSIVDFQVSPLRDEDWVSRYVSGLKPVVCAGFYFYNDDMPLSQNDQECVPVKLNSALAFGSGHHQTTQACLLNMRHFGELANVPVNILDMGCGTGILGICALKTWKDAKLTGIDIDPEAVRITGENYRLNSIAADAIVASNVTMLTQKFDLIFCNILKQPLIDLCDEFTRIMNPGACIITSGFITIQEQEVLARYRSAGFCIANRIQIEDWLSIMFKYR